MDFNVYKSKFSKLTKERQWIFPALTILTISQLFSLFMLFHKKDRIVLIPPISKHPMWIEDYAVSETYLEQMGMFVGGLLLSNSANSVKSKMDITLQYTHPSAYSTIRQYLIGEEEHLKKHQGSYCFHVQATQLDRNNHTILLLGERESYVGGKCVDRSKEAYRLSFEFNHGKYLLSSCVKEKVV